MLINISQPVQWQIQKPMFLEKKLAFGLSINFKSSTSFQKKLQNCSIYIPSFILIEPILQNAYIYKCKFRMLILNLYFNFPVEFY